MQNIINTVKSSGLKVLETLTPVLKDSKFQETGVLTPEEFVAAGDHLVHHCPSWQWASGDEASARDYLPKDKQFLITRNVPCYKRCRQMDDYVQEHEKVLGGDDDLDDGDGGWVDTHHYTEKSAGSSMNAGDSVSNAISEMTLGDEQPKQTLPANLADDSDEGDAVDMEDFVESGMLDEAALDVAATAQVQDQKAGDTAGAIGGVGEILSTRTYDLNICYDKYYQTPRLFLFGYNEQRKALSVEEMYEDFSADHANKTITMETHPHLPGPPQASVHPCRHAQVMKKLIDQIVEGGNELGVHIMEPFKIIQCSRLLSSISTDSGLSWSSDHQLAIITSKGVYIMDIVPNSTNTSPSLNFEPLFLPIDKESNPWQRHLDIKISEDEKVIDSMRTSVLLDNAIYVGATGNAENDLLKQVSCVKWTNGILGSPQCSLVTLTHGHRLRVYCRIGKTWQTVLDISQQLNTHLKQRMWRDTEEQMLEVKPSKRTKLDDTQRQIISRSYFMATTAFEWSAPLVDDYGNLYSILVTAQKNGTLILWKVRVNSNFSPGDRKLGSAEGLTIEVHKFWKPKIGMISSLDLITLDANTALLLIGGFNGRVKAMLVEHKRLDEEHIVNMTGMCVLWEEADRLAVREVILVKHRNDYKNRSRTLCMILVKSCYLVILHIKFDERNGSSMEVISHVTFGTGPSNIISVEPVQNANQEIKFIVACREGSLHLLTLESDSSSDASCISMVGIELVSGYNDGASIDMKNYRCHGLRRSKNGIWVLLQNGFLDDNRPKGRLTFLTQKTFSTLSKSIFDESHSQNMNNIPSMKDDLEVYRLLACTEAKDKNNRDGSFSFVLLDLIKKDLERCVEGGAIRTEKMQLYLWMCHLFGTLSTSEEMIGKWDSLADVLHRDILCLHALKVLRMYCADWSDPSFNSDIYDDTSIASLRTFYINFWNGDKEEVKKMKIPPYRWKCNFCLKSGGNESEERNYTDCFRCVESNHTWPRCVLTLKKCEQPNLLKCRWCESVALKMPLLDYTNVYCSICSGPFT